MTAPGALRAAGLCSHPPPRSDTAQRSPRARPNPLTPPAFAPSYVTVLWSPTSQRTRHPPVTMMRKAATSAAQLALSSRPALPSLHSANQRPLPPSVCYPRSSPLGVPVRFAVAARGMATSQGVYSQADGKFRRCPHAPRTVTGLPRTTLAGPRLHTYLCSLTSALSSPLQLSSPAP